MRSIAAFVAIALALAPQIAMAADAPSQDDPVQLEKSIEDQSAALATDDCETACKALASMQRATDRLCKMDPGPNCTRARSVVESATRRVRDACPACASAFPVPPPAPPPAPDVGTTKAESDEPLATQAAPPSESRRGGCAGCDTAGGPPASDALLFALAALGVRRRRSKRRAGQ